MDHGARATRPIHVLSIPTLLRVASALGDVPLREDPCNCRDIFAVASGSHKDSRCNEEEREGTCGADGQGELVSSFMLSLYVHRTCSNIVQ